MAALRHLRSWPECYPIVLVRDAAGTALTKLMITNPLSDADIKRQPVSAHMLRS
jgi:hypothetical protein